MNRVARDVRHRANAVCAIAALGTLLSVGCDDNDEAYYYDPDAYAYGYSYYYPADLGYADAYYADDLDDFDDDFVLGAQFKQAAGSVLPGGVIRELASGKNVCPGQVTITKQGSAAACNTGASAPPASTTILFDACQLRDGGQLDGHLRIEASQMAQDANCDDATLLDVRYTVTLTDLSHTAPEGDRVVLPALTLTGTYTRPLSGPPESIAITIEGEIDRIAASGVVELPLQVSGSQTLTPFAPDSGFRVDGTLTLKNVESGQISTASSDELARTADCCHPTGGTLDVEHSGGGTDHWTFGPDCGAVFLDGNRISVDECP